MIVKSLEVEKFVEKYLCLQPSNAEDTNCCVFTINECLKPIDAVKLNFHLVILCAAGKCDVIVGHHNFSIESRTVSIVPTSTIFSIRQISKDFDACFLLFNADFIKNGFVKSEIMEELLYINSDYPPIFDLNQEEFNDSLYKFKK